MHPSKVAIKIKQLSPDAVFPKYATEGSAGFDLVAIEDTVIDPGQTVLIKTGLSMEIPPGWELQIRPRSGISLKTPLRVANAPGTIDSDYRGEVCVIVTNIADNHYKSQPGSGDTDGSVTMTVEKGDKIAQAVLCPVSQAHFEIVGTLSKTKRGSGGFGSTGV
jgi:dUTP pyrophosphatase